MDGSLLIYLNTLNESGRRNGFWDGGEPMHSRYLRELFVLDFSKLMLRYIRPL